MQTLALNPAAQKLINLLQNAGETGLSKKQNPVIAVHGGAGNWPEERRQPGLKGVQKSAKTGFEILKTGGSALDSVTEAVASMEDDGLFNAGYGSSLNIEKKVEMDASIMDGKTLQAGAVALLRDIKNPVRFARLIMEKTDHVFIAGEGADKLAKVFKVPRRNPVTQPRLEQYTQQKKLLLEGKTELPKALELIKANPKLLQTMDTVGAVALDEDDNLAAATSTGGYALRLSGRIGDSPLIGCGNYADNATGACSATGIGEIAIRLVLAKTVCNNIEKGNTAQKATEQAIKLVNTKMPGPYNSMGLIAVDKHGRIGAAHNSPNICWAYMTTKTKEPIASLTAKITKETL
jgi:beta-aspartyl-peptidase (threonine type)